jgi:hypothetical protein
MTRDQLATIFDRVAQNQADALEATRQELTRALDHLFPPAPAVRLVRSGENLQAALDDGGAIELEGGAVFESQRFIVRRPIHLRTRAASLVGTGGPALHVLPGTSDVRIEGPLQCFANRWDNSVIQLGDNSSERQGRLEDVPRRIFLRGVEVPTFRGKRAFEVHAADVDLVDCRALDVYHPAAIDNQGVWIHSTPGPVRIRGGEYQAGSEAIMTAGETIRIPGCVPSDVLIEDVRLTRPLEWKTDGINRGVKNLLEFKSVRRAQVRRVVMDGCWRSAQDGWAVMLTPTRGGEVVDVLLEHVTMRNVGGGVNIAGRDSAGINLTRTSGIVFRDCSLVASRASFGGRGILALMTGGPGTVDFERVVSVTDGTQVVLQEGAKVERVSLVNSLAVPGQYAFTFSGNHWGGNWQVGCELLDVRDNVFAEPAAAALKRNLPPSNTYVAREEFDQRVLERLTAA